MIFMTKLMQISPDGTSNDSSWTWLFVIVKFFKCFLATLFEIENFQLKKFNEESTFNVLTSNFMLFLFRTGAFSPFLFGQPSFPVIDKPMGPICLSTVTVISSADREVLRKFRFKRIKI
jgi:hypothetical protein